MASTLHLCSEAEKATPLAKSGCTAAFSAEAKPLFIRRLGQIHLLREIALSVTARRDFIRHHERCPLTRSDKVYLFQPITIWPIKPRPLSLIGDFLLILSNPIATTASVYCSGTKDLLSTSPPELESPECGFSSSSQRYLPCNERWHSSVFLGGQGAHLGSRIRHG